LGTFNEGAFWAHIRLCAGRVGFIFDAAVLYFCMADDATPAPIQGLIAAALAYFVLPTDAIPDWTPIYGWVDDGAVLAGTLALVRHHLTDAHRRRARALFTGDVGG